MKPNLGKAKIIKLGYGKVIVFGGWLKSGRPGLAICEAKKQYKPRGRIEDESEIGPLIVGFAFKDRDAIEHLRSHLDEILEKIDAQEGMKP